MQDDEAQDGLNPLISVAKLESDDSNDATNDQSAYPKVGVKASADRVTIDFFHLATLGACTLTEQDKSCHQAQLCISVPSSQFLI